VWPSSLIDVLPGYSRSDGFDCRLHDSDALALTDLSNGPRPWEVKDGLDLVTTDFRLCAVAGRPQGHRSVHGAARGDVFKVRCSPARESEYARFALFNVLVYLNKTFIHACRAMREEQPEKILQSMFKMMERC